MRLEIEIQLDAHMHPPVSVWQYELGAPQHRSCIYVALLKIKRTRPRLCFLLESLFLWHRYFLAAGTTESCDFNIWDFGETHKILGSMLPPLMTHSLMFMEKKVHSPFNCQWLWEIMRHFKTMCVKASMKGLKQQCSAFYSLQSLLSWGEIPCTQLLQHPNVMQMLFFIAVLCVTCFSLFLLHYNLRI